MLHLLLVAMLQAASATSSIDCAQPKIASFAISSAPHRHAARHHLANAAPVVWKDYRDHPKGYLTKAELADAYAFLPPPPAPEAVLDGLKDVDLTAAPRLYARVEFLRMAAYAVQKDESGFAKTRSRLLNAENQALARLSPVVERFDTGAYRITAYKAAFNQGGFARKFEFIIEPTTPFAFPRSIMLTDDLNARSIMSQLGGKADTAANIYFVDFYTCGGHSTLPPPPFSKAGVPAYADVKPIVISALSQPAQPEATTSLLGACPTSQWITPGLAH